MVGTPPTPQLFCQVALMFLLVPIYSWVERGTARAKCFVQEHTTVTRPVDKPGPLDATKLVQKLMSL